MNRFISRDTALQLLHTLQEKKVPASYDFEKHRVLLLDGNGNEQVSFRLPLTIPSLDAGLQFQEQPVHYVIVLIQAGNCAMGYFEDGKNLDHKVYRSYMVRKKQGKSQIKYLKTKGKSRAGSRVRLGETLEFFQNINGRLQEYFTEHSIQRIALSCSKTLLPYLYEAKIAPPFPKRDERIFKIPKHIHTPIYEVLLNTNKFLCKGELIYDPVQQALIDQLLSPELMEEPEEEEIEDNEAEEDFYPE